MAPRNFKQWKIQTEGETREQSVTELRLKSNFEGLDIFPAGDESVSRIKKFWGLLQKYSELNPHETFWVHQAKKINQSTPNTMEDGQCSELEDIRKSKPLWATWGRKSCRAQSFSLAKTASGAGMYSSPRVFYGEIHQYLDGMEGMKV